MTPTEDLLRAATRQAAAEIRPQTIPRLNPANAGSLAPGIPGVHGSRHAPDGTTVFSGSGADR